MRHQTGFSLISLLMLVMGITAGLVYLLIVPGPNVSATLARQKTSQLVAQAEFIAQRIAKCATDYPAGDNGMALHKAYPVDANPGSVAIATLVCPGNGQNLWSGVDGVYLPAPIADFSGWTYVAGSPVSIAISSSQPGAYSGAIADAAARLGSAALASADTLTLKVIE